VTSAAIDRIALDRALVAQGGLHQFIRLAWHLVESKAFSDNWHIGAMAEHLEACERRQIRKLILNVPPGCMKSLTVSVFYPVWCWIQNPGEKFIFASYDASLSERDARKMRDIITSEWFVDRWGALLPKNALKQVRNFSNFEHGFRFSTSVEGKMTGRHGDQLWVDDPIKPQDTTGAADSTRKMLDNCITWYRGTMYNRMANPSTTVHGLMMQRLHDIDLSGVMRDEGGWEHLMLPMRYEPKRACVTVLGPADQRTEEGELLWPARFPEPEVRDLELKLGAFASAQMQQNPVPATGGVFQRDWMKLFWSPNGEIPGTIALPKLQEMSTLQSWDCTFKKTEGSDFVVGQAWGRERARFFLLGQVRGRMNYPDLKIAIKNFSLVWPRILRKLVEDKANGSAVIDDLAHDVAGLEPVDPEGGKEARANAVSWLFKAGNVILPHPKMAGCEWVLDYIEEMARFPKAPHDDQVDCTTQALTYLALKSPRWIELMRQAAENDRAAAPVPEPVEATPAAPPVDIEKLRQALGKPTLLP
jgi:predicted phage terminase large subunit-like protein